MAKLSAEDIRLRIVALESVYTQKELSEKLGISKRSLNYYAKGERAPNKKATEKINRTFNKTKARIIPEKIESREKKRVTESKRQKILRETFRTAPIIEYMYTHKDDLDLYPGAYERLEELIDNAYVCAWVGRTVNPPRECQFIIQGEDPSRAGMWIQAIVVASRNSSPNMKNGYNRMDMNTVTLTISRYTIPNFRKMTFTERLDAIRRTVFNTPLDRGVPMDFIGFYFAEGDE